MKKIIGLAVLSAALCTSSLTFAGDLSQLMDSSCRDVVKACKAGGYTRGGDKKLWKECMHPIMLGQTVKDVTVDANKVKACRDHRITILEKELKELQSVK